MAVETNELSHGTGVILTCTTTDRAFGPIFRADVDVVEQFLTWCHATYTEDVRQLDADGILSAKFEEFRAAYVCPLCPDATPQEGHMSEDLDLCKGCGKFYCGTHQGDDQWTDKYDGKTIEYGHKC